MSDPRPFDSLGTDRRTLLRRTGALALGGVAAGTLGSRLRALGPAMPLPLAVPISPAPGAALLNAPPAAVLQSTCAFTPTSIEGPYYLDLDHIRQDISEGKPGVPVWLILQVLRNSDCQPLPNVAVDIWHCDALGQYSGFASQGTLGQTFCRGTQITDSAGLVIFKTIYPGWYHGRSCHLHFKVYPSSTTEFTGQLYYPQFVSDFIYANLAPYTQKGPANTTHLQDPYFTPPTVQAWIPNPDGSTSIYSGLILGVH